MTADIMAVFAQYDIDGLNALHPQTVAALYQQAHRIEQKQLRRATYAAMLRNSSKALDTIKDY